MSFLKKELQDQRDELAGQRGTYERMVRECADKMADLDLAIAALTPQNPVSAPTVVVPVPGSAGDVPPRHGHGSCQLTWQSGDLQSFAASNAPASPTVSDREEEGGLLESQPEPSAPEVRKQDEQDAADPFDSPDGRTNFDPAEEAKARGEDPAAPPPPQEAPAIPEGFIPWSGGECPVEDGVVVETMWRDGRVFSHDADIPARHAFEWGHGFDRTGPGLDIIAYRIIKASADAERIEDARDGTLATEQTEHDRPKLTNEEWDNAPKFDDAPPNAAFIAEAELAINDKSEDEPVIHPDAAFWAKALPAEAEAKAEPKRINIFGIEFGGGTKKTLVGERV